MRERRAACATLGAGGGKETGGEARDAFGGDVREGIGETSGSHDKGMPGGIVDRPTALIFRAHDCNGARANGGRDVPRRGIVRHTHRTSLHEGGGAADRASFCNGNGAPRAGGNGTREFIFARTAQHNARCKL